MSKVVHPDSPVAPTPSSSPPPPKRWRPNHKMEVVLRMIKGESIDALSRELGVEAHRLSAWRKQGLAGLQRGLVSEQPAEPPELVTAKKALLEATMTNELLREQIRRGIGPFRGGRSRK